jgi:glucose-6-phosphate 1-dehydrogenase
VEMDFSYPGDYSVSLPEAYESLLLDALDGWATQFMRADQIEWAWKVVMPILDAWKKYPKKQLRSYPAGTWGPAAASALLKPFAKDWYHLPDHEATAPGAAPATTPPSTGNGIPKASATPVTSTPA